MTRNAACDLLQVKDVVDRIKESPERELLLTLERAGAQLQLPVVPELAPDGSGRLGLQLSTRYTLRHTKVEGLGEAATYAASEFARIWGQVAGGLWQVFTNFGAMASQLSGPVAIVAAGSRIAQVG